MLKQVYEINEYGYPKEIYVKDFDEEGNCTEELAEDIITVDSPNGLYRAKWTGTEWIEGLSQEEIDEINNVPSLPTTEERLQQAEDTILFLLMGGV